MVYLVLNHLKIVQLSLIGPQFQQMKLLIKFLKIRIIILKLFDVIGSLCCIFKSLLARNEFSSTEDFLKIQSFVLIYQEVDYYHQTHILKYSLNFQLVVKACHYLGKLINKLPNSIINFNIINGYKSTNTMLLMNNCIS